MHLLTLGQRHFRLNPSVEHQRPAFCASAAEEPPAQSRQLLFQGICQAGRKTLLPTLGAPT